MATTRLDFYLDVMSPYTYFAWQVLKRYRSIWNLEVCLRPFFLGAVMQSSGNQPPATIPGKARFMHNDLIRTARWLGLTSFQHMPSNFFTTLPKLTLKLNRIAAVFEGEEQWRLVDASFALIWESSEFRDQEKAFVLPRGEADFIERVFVLAKVPYPGIETIDDEIVPKGRAVVKTNTDKALGLGAFGAPVFHFPDSHDSEIFFGSDRWEQMAFVFGKRWLGPMAAKL